MGNFIYWEFGWIFSWKFFIEFYFGIVSSHHFCTIFPEFFEVYLFNFSLEFCLIFF